MKFRKTEKQQNKDQKNNIMEGIFWAIMFYFLVLFLVPFALHFGATPFQIGLLESLPLFIGSLVGLFSYSLLKFFNSKKQLIVIFSLFQVVVCVLLALVYFFVSKGIVWIIIILYVIFNVFEIVGRVIHTDWIGKVLLLKKMGKYTAQKQILLQFFSIVPILASGLLLDTLLSGQSILLGFTIIIGFAGLFRLIATYFVNKISTTEDKEDIKVEIKRNKVSLFKVISRDVIKNKEYKYFLLVIFILYFSLFVSAPFYKFYFLNTLGLSFFSYVALHIVAIISTILSLRYWGKINDIYGASKILKATVFFFPFYSLLLVFFHRNIWLLVLLNFFDGMIAGGFIVAIKTYFYQNTRRDLITHFALFTIIQSTGVIVGTFFGSMIIVKATEFFGVELHAMWTVFIVATLFRFIAVLYVLGIKDNYIKDPVNINLVKDILMYVPVRKGFNKYSRYLLDYEKNVFDKINFNNINILSKQKEKEKK